MAMFSAVFAGVAVTAQQDFFEIVAPASGIVVIHRVVLSQSSDVGDAQEEGLSILVKRGSTTSGSGGTAPTAVDLGPTGLTFGGAVEANNTTKATAGTILTLHAENWNVRGPFDYLPTPECRPVLVANQRATVELATTPADSLTISGTLVFETG